MKTLCSDEILKETSQAVQTILHDCLKDGLPSILNNLQLSKNRQIQSDSINSLLNGGTSSTSQMTCLFANGLNSILETSKTQRTSRNSESLHDLEAYADLMECMSEIQEVDARVQNCVDEVDFNHEDRGFLGTYEDFSFCSTAQVQNGNVN